MADEMRIGSYILTGELGHGAMARVWRALDPNLEREVAIKEPLFDPRLSEDELKELGRRFVAEGRAAARLNHPNIVQIHAADVWDGRPAIVMELVEGRTLTALIAEGPMPAARVLSVLDQLLDAVGYAHARGVVHRDIKPDNVFVTPDGCVKLADFGIARIDDASRTRATVVGAVLGTPGYMSPEQVLGHAVDHRSDLFSVGVVGYEMLTGKNPFGRGEATTLMYRTAHEPAPELPEGASEGLPADLRPAIMCALAKDPQDRPQSAADFRAMLHGEEPAVQSGQQATMPLRAGSPWPESAFGAPTQRLERKVPPQQSQGQERPESSGRNWVPYVAIAAVCVVALVVIFLSATSGGSRGSVSDVVEADNVGEAAKEALPDYYVASAGGFVAIFASDQASPYEVSDVDVTNLDEDVAAELDAHIAVASIDEAHEVVEEMLEAAERKRASRSSQVSNLTNGGHMDLADDGKLYYAVPVDGTDWDTRAIVRSEADGSNRQTIYSGGGSTINLYHISVIEGSVVFNREDQGQSTVVIASADGSRVTTLDTCDAWSLCQVEDSWVYYLKGGQLRRCSMSGGSATGYATLGSATLWRVWGGRLLTFAKQGGNRVLVSNLDGSAEQVIYSAEGGYTVENAFPVDDQGIAVWVRSGSDDEVVYVNPARTIERVLWRGSGMERMCSFEDGVIITAKVSGNAYRIFSVTFEADPGELDLTVPLSGEVRYTTHMDDDRVYFGVLDTGRNNHCSLHSVSMEGTGIRDITG